ncbi:MAG: MarC family protein [Burkholderiaceae bacterium]|nr:MarC family protein [Burkholderiaceae bacterium]
MDTSFVSAVVLLLIVCDPFGNVPVFISALQDVPRERRLAIILRECLIAFAVLVTFVFIGDPFLRLLGLSELSLQIGGGVVLMLVALRMVFPTRDGIFGQSPGGEPFSRDPARLWQWVAAIAVVMAASAVVLAFSERIMRLLGERVTLAFERLLGLVLAAIAVELILRGIKTFVGSL